MEYSEANKVSDGTPLGSGKEVMIHRRLVMGHPSWVAERDRRGHDPTEWQGAGPKASNVMKER
jgi:hypothetical protein